MAHTTVIRRSIAQEADRDWSAHVRWLRAAASALELGRFDEHQRTMARLTVLTIADHIWPPLAQQAAQALGALALSDPRTVDDLVCALRLCATNLEET